MYTRGEGGRSYDITGGLTPVRMEALTSTVTGRGRASTPYVGHIKNPCRYKFSQLTNQAAELHRSPSCL